MRAAFQGRMYLEQTWKYEEYQKIKREYENFPRESEIGQPKNIFTMGQRDYERLYPPRNIVLSRISEESITDY